MAFRRRALGFQSLRAGIGWLATATFAALLLGCGGDTIENCPVIACVDIPKPTASWQNQQYTIVTSAAGTEPVTLEAIVTVQRVYIMSTDVVTVEPSAPNQNPGPDATSYPVVVVGDANNQVGQAVVRFAVRVVSDAGSYPKGEFPFTATFRRGEDVVVAETKLVVQ